MRFAPEEDDLLNVTNERLYGYQVLPNAPRMRDLERILLFGDMIAVRNNILNKVWRRGAGGARKREGVPKRRDEEDSFRANDIS